MDQRQGRKQVKRVGLFDGPSDLGSVGGDVAEHTERSLYEVGEPGLFAAFRLTLECVDCQRRQSAPAGCESLVDEIGAIAGEPRHVAEPLGESFGGFKDGVKEVLAQDLRAAVAEYLDVSAPAGEFGVETIRELCRLGQGAGLRRVLDATVVCTMPSSERTPVLSAVPRTARASINGDEETLRREHADPHGSAVDENGEGAVRVAPGEFHH